MWLMLLLLMFLKSSMQHIPVCTHDLILLMLTLLLSLDRFVASDGYFDVPRRTHWLRLLS